jgi:hypothetical protein
LTQCRKSRHWPRSAMRCDAPGHDAPQSFLNIAMVFGNADCGVATEVYTGSRGAYAPEGWFHYTARRAMCPHRRTVMRRGAASDADRVPPGPYIFAAANHEFADVAQFNRTLSLNDYFNAFGLTGPEPENASG